jgi:phosphonate transport system substrate-binding protein
MTYQLSVSPDFSPDHLAGWYVFNTWVQRLLGERCHLQLHDDYAGLNHSLGQSSVDMIYADAATATRLMREQGFEPLVSPLGETDEAVIAVAADSELTQIEQFRPGLRLAHTADPDVCLLGRLLLEPAALDEGAVVWQMNRSYVLVAKQVILGKAESGLFLKRAYDGLSATIRRQLRVLVSSDIGLLKHVLLIGPRMAQHAPALRAGLVAMHEAGDEGRKVLDALSLCGWEGLSSADTDFMADLIQALQT